MRRYSLIALVGILGGLILALAGPWAGPPPAALGANPNVGYVDFSFGSGPGSVPGSSDIDATADKPQSKLWYNDGLWWALMFNTASNNWRIYKLSWPDTWVDTGTVVDNRATSRGDALWDGAHLYVASLVRFGTGSTTGRLYRFTYDAGAKIYSLEAPFPVPILDGSAETMAFDKDSTGKLWITYTQSNQVYVRNSTTNDWTWGDPLIVPGARTLDQDDISSLVAYRDASGPSIGVLWSNHVSPSSMYFSYHKDGDADTTWSTPEQIYMANCAADDHINLKSLQADPSGAIYAAVKTSFGDSGCGGSSSSPLIRLVVRKPDNTWLAPVTFGTVSDDHTRPQVLLDTTNRKVYMFATSPTSCGVIYMKSTSMDNLKFLPTGKGTPFISSSTYTCINNVTSTKQTVNAATDLVVMASDESQDVYLHNVLDIPNISQTITFNPPTGKRYLDPPFTVSATASSGLPVSFSASGACTVSGNMVALTVAGSCAVTASQAGDANYNPATPVTQTFTIARADQTIGFSPPLDKRFGDPPFAVSATASSGLPVSFSDANSSDVCAVSGNTVTLTGAGSCAVKSSQAGDTNYNAAPSVTPSFNIAKADQTITFNLPPNKRYGDPPFRITASASSGLPVSFSASGPCTITDKNLVTLTGSNDCSIQATQSGSANYNSAPAVIRTISSKYMISVPMAIAFR